MVFKTGLSSPPLLSEETRPDKRVHAKVLSGEFGSTRRGDVTSWALSPRLALLSAFKPLNGIALLCLSSSSKLFSICL